MSQIDCLAFSPHPDDAELFCGGLLLKLKSEGCSTGIIDLTQGELSTNGSIGQRAQEAQQASKILKLEIRENLKIPDGQIEDNKPNQLKIIRVLRQYRPKICLFPYWRDRHPDHEQSSELLKHAFFKAGLNKIDTGQPEFRPGNMLFYMLHFDFEPTFVVDISAFMEQKLAAIMAYQSQFLQKSGTTGKTYINRPGFIESIKNRCAYYGDQVGVRYAEPYLYQGRIKIDNILDSFA